MSRSYNIIDLFFLLMNVKLILITIGCKQVIALDAIDSRIVLN